MTSNASSDALELVKVPRNDEQFNLIAQVNNLLTLLSVSQSNAINRVHACQNIKLTPLSLLYEIVERDGIATQTELAERFPYTKQAMTLAIDTLVENDLVYRRPNETDRRVKDIVITDNGLAVVKKAREIQKDFYSRFSEILSQDELHILRDLLQRVNAFYKSI